METLLKISVIVTGIKIHEFKLILNFALESNANFHSTIKIKNSFKLSLKFALEKYANIHSIIMVKLLTLYYHNPYDNKMCKKWGFITFLS